MVNERDLAYQTSADELIIRIIRGTYDMRIGRRNAILFPRLHIFLFNDEKGAAKASRNKIINLWTNDGFWGKDKGAKGIYKNDDYFFNKMIPSNTVIKNNIKELVDISLDVLSGAAKINTILKSKSNFWFQIR